MHYQIHICLPEGFFWEKWLIAYYFYRTPGHLNNKFTLISLILAVPIQRSTKIVAKIEMFIKMYVQLNMQVFYFLHVRLLTSMYSKVKEAKS